MNIFKKLSDLSNERVKKFGAQYYIFAIFGIINYPFTSLIEIYFMGNTKSVWIRLVASLLCFILLFNKQWSHNLKKYLPLYWYFTVTFSLPIIATFLLLSDNFSIGWLINFNIGVMILVLLLDSVSFVVLEILGIALGISLFYVSTGSFPNLPSHEYSSLFLYMFLCVVILGTIFSRNREIFNNCIQKAKDDANSQLEQKVAERTEELEEALKAKTEFLNNMSHEVRTPITGVEGISQGLVDNWDKFNDAERLEFAKKVASNATRLRSLVGNLLDLSKFTAGKMILDFKNMNLNESVHSMIDEVQELYLQNKPISFKFKESFSQNLIADQERIAQVMRNLFVNAVKFSPADKKSTITASLEKTKLDDKPAILFSLSDEGVGVPEKELEAIFDPFTQSTKTKTRAGGTGLGLAICKEIIEAHGGKIWAENNKKVGASFSFIIPVDMDENNEHSFGFKPAKPKKEKPTVLFIDDEDSCRITMNMILLSVNYTVITADGGIKGLEILKDKHEEIDIILVDLMMPDMYGLDVLKAIKAEKKYSRIPVILQTGTSEQKELDKAKELGSDGYIKKPYIKDSVLLEIAKKLA